MKAVILAGGLGKRLHPLTEVIPKPLLPIGEKALLEIQIEYLKMHGFETIYLCTYYKSEYIRNFFGDGSRYGVNLSIVKEEKPLGTAGPIKLIGAKLDSPFILMNGDILTRFDLSAMYGFALGHSSLLTIGTKELISKSPFGSIFFDGDFVSGIEEKPEIRSVVLAGVCVLKPGILGLIPDREYFGMDSLIQAMIAQKLPITHFSIEDDWLDIGRIEDYEKAQEIYKEHFQ